MNDLLLIFLSLSVSGSVLVLILLAIKPLVKKRLSQTWQYYIWLIVILRFLLPFTPEVTLIGELSNHFQNIPISLAGIDERQTVDINGANITDRSADTFQAPNQVTQNSGTESPVKTSYWREIKNNVWMIWLAMALILLVHKIMSYHSFIRLVKVGAKAVANQHLLDIYKNELEAAKIRRKLPFYVNAQVISPMLIGFFRPAIIIPMLSVDDDELRQIFRHELTHYKRSDVVYKWLVQIALCVHWFNPLVYWMSKEINRGCELSCDESVIKNLDMNSRILYGDALIASLNAQGNHKNFNISLTMGEDANFIKERLDMMMNYKKKSKFVVCVTFLLTILFLFGFSFLGAYASSKVKSEGSSVWVSPGFSAFTVQFDGTKTDNGYRNSSTFEPILSTYYTCYFVKPSAKEQFSQDSTSETTNLSEYAKWNVTNKDGIFYYDNHQIRLFVDMAADNSFKNFFYDENGSIDIRLIRNSKGSIVKSEYISEDETDELLSDFDVSSSAVSNQDISDSLDKELSKSKKTSKDIMRQTTEEIPNDVQKVISSCDNETWYVIQGKDRSYIYYNHLTRDYAYQYAPNENSIVITDIGKSTNSYVLLSIPLISSLKITYNSNSVTYTKIPIS